jgi:hypothetical protein
MASLFRLTHCGFKQGGLRPKFNVYDEDETLISALTKDSKAALQSCIHAMRNRGESPSHSAKLCAAKTSRFGNLQSKGREF